MSLEIRHNRAEHTHENVQFRRVAKKLIAFFEEKDWDGLLIGNPESEDFSRFRADAILLYNHGLIIIDFKDYQGQIKLPPNDREFQNAQWYNETAPDNERIVIKGGSRFINPFMQINSYRSAMIEVIKRHSILQRNLDASHICALNLFSGPITLSRDTPRNMPYYKITQESDLQDFLYDYSSNNRYSEESANAFKAIFPAAEWEAYHEDSGVVMVTSPKEFVEVEADLESTLNAFMSKVDSRILVLESMSEKERDDWVYYLQQKAHDAEIPQIETWIHSARIRRNVKSRSGIDADSLYAIIYGGELKLNESDEDIDEQPVERSEDEETLQEIVPIKKDDWLDERALIILYEGHLVSRSLHQSDLLRFGSGRLLEDLIKFLDLGHNGRKLICIGDPYSLSYGKAEESAIALDNLKELFEGEIMHYRSRPTSGSFSSKLGLRMLLAWSIDNGVFNHLEYSFDGSELIKVEKQEVLEKLNEWFCNPPDEDPNKAMLVYSNKDAGKINSWIKKNVLKNGAELAERDLLLVNNNIQIPDDTGIGLPRKVYNGMYVKVNEVLDQKTEYVQIKQSNSPVLLVFRKLQVKCLTISNKPDANIWILENYLKGEGGLSKNEQIAFRVYINKKVAAYKKGLPFEESDEYANYLSDIMVKELDQKIKGLEETLSKGGKVKTELEKLKVELGKIEKRYKRRYHQKALFRISSNDPFVNAAHVMYGWSITVHKAIGSQFSEICLNAYQGDNQGIRNSSYYRWLYSGFSTSIQRVFVINPQEINPLEDCLFEDTVESDWKEKQHTNIGLFEVKDFIVPEKYAFLFPEEINPNTKAIACLLADKLQSKNLAFKEVRRIDAYLSKIFFSEENQEVFSLVVAINNKGDGKVSSVRIERTNSISAEEFEEILREARSKNVAKNQADKPALPNDFRFSIYDKWQKNCAENGAHLSLEVSHSYQDVFTLVKGNQKIQFQAIYDGKGFIKKITVLAKTDSEISIDLHNWLLDE